MKNLLSARLRFEPLRATHAELICSSLQDPAIYTYLPEDPPSPEALQNRYAYLEKGVSPDGSELWLNWVAFLRDSTTPVGTFQATIPQQGVGAFAYIVFPFYWRQGFAKEMARCVMTHLFQAHKISNLSAEIDVRNVASIRLVESLGLTRIKTTHGADYFKGSTSDEYTYLVSRQDWMRRHRECT